MKSVGKRLVRRLAPASAITILTLTWFVGATPASAALADQCNFDQYCTAVSQWAPVGSGSEEIQGVCNETVARSDIDVNLSEVRCYVQSSSGIAWDSGWRQSGDAQASFEFGTGLIPVASYQLCIQAEYQGLTIIGGNTVGPYGPNTPICSSGPFLTAG